MATRSNRFQFDGREYSLLSRTSAMACYSFSLPAVFACPGMRANGSDDICSACYARINRYAMPTVLEPAAARFAWVCDMIDSGRADELAQILIRAIRDATGGEGYFRIHDSGDFFSLACVLVWDKVCAALPDVMFWAPTRSYHGRSGESMLGALADLNLLPNVVIRPSALQFDQAAPEVFGLSAGSTVVHSLPIVTVSESIVMIDSKLHDICPKTMAGHGASCESVGCRSCWTEPTEPTAYVVHGRQGRKVAHQSTVNEKTRRAEIVGSAMAKREHVPQLARVDGIRKDSADPARKAYKARRRAERFAARFGK